jgi:hypothetical protein
MELGTAVKLLNMYLELNPHRHDMGTAVKTVLAELDKQTESYEEGYRRGYNQGYMAGAMESI